MANENTVTLTLSSYNQIKAENVRLNMFIDNILNDASVNINTGKLVMDAERLEYALRLCCWEKYRKRLHEKEDKPNE